MTRFLLLLSASALASPAWSQDHGGHAPASATATATTNCTPEHAKMGHCTLPEPAPPPAAPAGSVPCTPEHAAMGHCTLPPPGQAPADPHAGHAMPAEPQPEPADPHAGHTTPSAQPDADPHAGHDMGQPAGPEIPVGSPPPEALSGPAHAADTVWGQPASEHGRNVLRREHGGGSFHKLLIDRAETRIRDGRDGFVFDAQAWFGGDIDKLWLKSEVEGEWGERPEHAEVQALWSHAIGPWFDLQAGARFDPQTGPDRAHLVLGVQGLAPYWWEIDGALFLSNKGELTARAEAEYDLRITQKLILQPRVEAELSAQDIDELGIGAGLSEASIGARLRYQLSPLFAPYVGVEYERAFGATADFRRAEGERRGGLNLLAGVRLWF